MPHDRSHGYEAVAEHYMAVRSDVGRDVVADWAQRLAEGGAVLDVGAGSGEPTVPILQYADLKVFALDASPAMVDALKTRFPNIPVACEAAEDSSFFDRQFDGVMAIGLVFLLTEAKQRDLLRRLADVLEPVGSLLFSAPYQACTWTDVLTGEPSTSLGAQTYRSILAHHGMKVIQTYTDEGGNHYFEAEKQAA
ncbi:hypothetical protein CCR85_02155 [Rhodothalassium salexigens]|uniref:class I SAM-dependent methyltransferase n=1 Tax=Rhodothalassium salexigens TaxID=1086 RepID=UPI001912AC7A|nr:class I SAM-dependent methyltransferase [Rhodothalassium salexigens]MBK5910294.1 hypothetical protein [Rhodothalassium salexigens]MBK5921093.1 hypothetical protein [Rhodothalassium salexigens]